VGAHGDLLTATEDVEAIAHDMRTICNAIRHRVVKVNQLNEYERKRVERIKAAVGSLSSEVRSLAGNLGIEIFE
jgi:hypothetical protein